jgi:hypothetical protein
MEAKKVASKDVTIAGLHILSNFLRFRFTAFASSWTFSQFTSFIGVIFGMTPMKDVN